MSIVPADRSLCSQLASAVEFIVSSLGHFRPSSYVPKLVERISVRCFSPRQSSKSSGSTRVEEEGAPGHRTMLSLCSSLRERVVLEPKNRATNQLAALSRQTDSEISKIKYKQCAM